MNSLPLASLSQGHVQASRLPDVVADHIRELILSGELEDGQRLPPLEGLLQQFGVSAPTMREALRVLEAEGLIRVQRGSIGGAVVRRPTPETAAYTLAVVLRSHDTPKGDVGEALSLLEPLCAMLCARLRNRKSQVVRELRKINADARALIDGDELAFNETMINFHTTLVQRCGNDTLRLLTGALGSICLSDVRTWAKATSAHGDYPTANKRLMSVEIHEQITDLIYAGKDLEVEMAMANHIQGARKFLYGEDDPTQPIDPRAVKRRD